MPSVSRYRTRLAVPADEIEDLKKAHPPMNGHTPVIWDKEHKLWFARPGADLSELDRWLPRPQDVSMNGSDPVTEFARVLENAGLVLKELPVMDGKIHRVPTADDKKGQKVAHIADSWTADLPAGTGIIAARMIRRSPGPSPAENRQIPAQDST